MGLFFMIAGYFTPAHTTAKAPAAFIFQTASPMRTDITQVSLCYLADLLLASAGLAMTLMARR